MLGALPRIAPRPQDDGQATYAAKIEKGEARLDFGRSADEVERQVRAFNPMPGAFFEFAGERIKIYGARIVDGNGEAGVVLDGALTIACARGAVAPLSVQRAGRAPMTPGELLRGFPIPAGTRL